MRTIIFILFIAFAGQGFSMTGEEYIKKINANYSSLKAFELVLDYKLYKGSTGANLRDSYSTTLQVAGQKSHRKIYTDEVITTEELSLIINHDMRTIQILPPAKERVFDKDLEKSLRQCDNIHVKKLEKGKLIVLTFKEYSTNAYSRVEVEIDDDFWIKKMTLYYANQMNFSKNYFQPELGYARLEVDYKSLKKRWKDKDKVTDITKYIVKKGEKYQTSDLYSTYELLR